MNMKRGLNDAKTHQWGTRGMRKSQRAINQIGNGMKTYWANRREIALKWRWTAWQGHSFSIENFWQGQWILEVIAETELQVILMAYDWSLRAMR